MNTCGSGAHRKCIKGFSESRNPPTLMMIMLMVTLMVMMNGAVMPKGKPWYSLQSPTLPCLAPRALLCIPMVTMATMILPNNEEDDGDLVSCPTR